ncbi:hypothetical protein GMOD_00009983 [Pyrenophora seminiperda CCB06]|uniref:Uncharacterized protein n=1 Tax=Pyrenophora seminiperda CCB06 TaxID=1302712 RepID=A0A3M7M1U1_9PLEO|nr:hypothetical protein GMOD_00009983 [Pyrenophora seminiperda CCB06]
MVPMKETSAAAQQRVNEQGPSSPASAAVKSNSPGPSGVINWRRHLPLVNNGSETILSMFGPPGRMDRSLGVVVTHEPIEALATARRWPMLPVSVNVRMRQPAPAQSKTTKAWHRRGTGGSLETVVALVRIACITGLRLSLYHLTLHVYLYLPVGVLTVPSSSYICLLSFAVRSKFYNAISWRGTFYTPLGTKSVAQKPLPVELSAITMVIFGCTILQCNRGGDQRLLFR